MGYYDLGTYRRKVTTNSVDARTWFDRGLLWSYSFNHEEAARCFRQAIEYDPECAMAYWGLAYAIGPNYNKAWVRYDQNDLTKTVQEAQAALKRGREAENFQPLEQALIEALSHRFPPVEDIPEDLKPFNHAYAEAMRKVYDQYGDDADVPILYGDSLMCIRPRQLWDLDTGEPTSPDTTAAVEILEAGLATEAGREHPAYCHLYIHLMEMTQNPEKALPAADRLRRLVPDGSHMQHMATHIDVAVGDYRRGIDSNRNAMLSDNKYFSENKASILYTAYRTHNIQVMAYCGMMSGRSKDALEAARHITHVLTPEFVSIKSPPMWDWTEHQVSLLAHTLVRFGRWGEILELELPADQELFCITTAIIRYARGVALSALGRLEEAKIAKDEFEAARAAVPKDRQYGITSKAEPVLKVASLMLEGEYEYRRGNFDEAFNYLREAIRQEDGLAYADPPLWMQPVRHALGALLLEQGQLDEATEVFKQDLGLSEKLSRRKARINNVWGLHGLYECFERSGKHDDARLIRGQRDIAIASADVPVGSSCFCRLSAQTAKSACC